MVGAQEWIKESYVPKERKSLTELIISYLSLEGELTLEGFISLKKLDCSHNQLTKLVVSKLSPLVELRCSNNKSLELELEDLPESLEKIYCQGCPQLEEQLAHYKKNDYYDYQA